ncbi:Acyl transferase domain containing protein [Rhypophila sp. PSN 637]
MKELNSGAAAEAAPSMPTPGDANALGNSTTPASVNTNVNISPGDGDPRDISGHDNNLGQDIPAHLGHGGGAPSASSMDSIIITPPTSTTSPSPSPSSSSSAAPAPATAAPVPVPVAICGIGLRLPSGSEYHSSALSTPSELFSFLTTKQDARSVVPDSRFNTSGYHTPHLNKPGTVNTEHGYYLPSSLLTSFDTTMFNYTSSEASHLDPAHRLTLQVVHEALTSAGELPPKLSPSQKYKIGVYAGVFSDDWQDMHRRDTQFYHPYHLLGSKDFALSNRVSYEFDLRGPSMTLKTACSSAGVALHEAVRAIQRGDIDGAVVTGVNLIMAPGMSVAMTLQGTLSAEGSCKTFDLKADGYARGEAVTAVYIKRADLAVREGNPVRAVIRGCASNADGRTKGLSVPSVDAHEECIRMAYRNAGLEHELDGGFGRRQVVVEAHGTGTKVGDPIEARAIARCFGGDGRRVYMGAVKPNMGHSEGAATLTSIIKAVVALENRVIIPNIKFETPNPEIPWEEANLVVPTEPIPWPENCAERYSVNSYGIGGSNAHFVIDSAASFGLAPPRSIPRSIIFETPPPLPTARKHALLLFSAAHAKSLKSMVQHHGDYLAQHPEQDLEDVAYTLAERRERLKYRGFSVVAAPGEQADAVDVVPVTCQGLDKVVFVFTGQGAQWANMGRQLMVDYPTFLDNIRDMDNILQALDIGVAPPWFIEDVLCSSSPDDRALLSQAEYSQPICTALQIALVDLLASFGIVPAAVVGHSSGEIAAAYAAGSLTKRDAIIAAFYRGWVCKHYSTCGIDRPKGGMAAVGLGKHAVKPFLGESSTGGKVAIACENSGESVTLSGDLGELEAVMARIRERHEGVLVRKLKVEMAYHSDHMRLIGDQYHDLISTHLQPAQDPTIPFYSSVHGGRILTDAADFGPRYWQQNLESPVLFHSAVKSLLKFSRTSMVHLEVGPHPTLRGPLRQIYQETSAHQQQYVGTLSRERNDTESFLSAVGQLFTLGYPIQWPVSPSSRVVSDLPTYPWHHDPAVSHWHTTRPIQNWRFRQHLPHDLLGVRTIDGSNLSPTWRNSELLVADVPWLRDHMVGNDIIFPGTGYVAMAGEAVFQLLCEKVQQPDQLATLKRDYTVKEVTLHQALVLNDETPAETITTLKPQRITASLDSTEWYEFSIVSYKPSSNDVSNTKIGNAAQGVWNKHCTGLVRSGSNFKRRPYQTRKPPPKSLPRRVSSQRWYTTMSRIGLNYGPRFTGLRDISSDVINHATGKSSSGADKSHTSMIAKIVDNTGEQSESAYALHPSTLDLILQSWTVASVQGQYRKFTQLALPTFIQEWYVGDLGSSPHDDKARTIQIKTNSTGRPGLGVVGESFGIVPTTNPDIPNENELVYFLTGFKATPIESMSSPSSRALTPDSPDSATSEDMDLPEQATQMSLQLHWKPAINFLPNTATLTRPKYNITPQLSLSEELFVLCALESLPLVDAIPFEKVTQPHFLTYRDWLSRQVERIMSLSKSEAYPLVPAARSLVSLDSSTRQEKISSVLEECISSGVGKIATAIHRTFTNLPAVFTGEADFLDLLIHDNTLAGIYDWMNAIWDYTNFFTLLGHSQPQMRILEIGAGTGGLTSRILPLLCSNNGGVRERLYQSYTFTDVSSGFFPAAQKRFADYEGVEYKVLDISSDPLTQGFEEGSYDLIIASNVLHATPDLRVTLEHVRKLVHPTRGRMFLQELSPVTQGMVYIMGLFSGWWLGGADGRVDKPYVEVEEWDSRLKNAGWAGVESVAFDNARGHHINANMVVRPDGLGTIAVPSKVSLLLRRGQEMKIVDKVESRLREKGHEVERYIWGDEVIPPADQDLISFVDLGYDLAEGPLLHNPSDKDWRLFLETVQSLQMASTVWLTPPVQIDAKDPHAGLVLGVVRTIRSEQDPPLATLELEEWDSDNAASAIVDVLGRVQTTKDEEGDLAPDLEFAFHDGLVHVGRFHWSSVPEALKETANSMGPPDTKALEIGKQGLLQSLYWCGQSLPPLPEDHVQLEIQAVGMNFRDILIAVGVLSRNAFSADDVYPLGLEGAGLVTKVGAKVSHLRVGDRVMTLGTNPNLATQIQRPAEFAIRIDEGLSFSDAATLPGVYCTLLMGLVDRAKLRRGQSILIHAAAGGIGIAAIHLARWIGAEIYCTAGTEEKVAFLADEMGISRDHIFHSRDTSFRDDLLEATDGVGVDVALNSTSGEMLHATWDCLASHGVMLEIGKRDMIGRGFLAMDKFEDNRTFIGVDLWRYALNDVPEVGRLLRWVNQLYLEGHVQPIRPVTLFPASKIQDAFRFMQQGQHMGKIVITFPDETENDGKNSENALQWTRAMPTPSFQSDKAYLLVGGMGGLGQAIATWMVDHGARHLVFLSRSAGRSDDDRLFISELKQSGCAVQTWSGDVSDPDVVKRTIESCPRPIAGVMQMAMILRDMGTIDMDLETYQAVIKPRVEGTWNLHNLLPDNGKHLDFFLLFSSVCGIVGNYGQANYAASNTFMDAFVQYRRARNLPASVIDIGAVDEVGYISRTPTAKENMLASAGKLITEQAFLDSLQLAIARSSLHGWSAKDKSRDKERYAGYTNPSQVTQALECRLPIMHPENAIIWKRDPRWAIYRNIEKTNDPNSSDGSGQNGNGGIKAFLMSVRSEPSQLETPAAADFLAGEIRNRVSTFLMRREDEDGEAPLDVGLTLSEAGVDSLVAIELRNWWKQNLGVEVSVLELMNGGSMRRLGDLAVARLKARFLVGK